MTTSDNPPSGAASTPPAPAAPPAFPDTLTWEFLAALTPAAYNALPPEQQQAIRQFQESYLEQYGKVL